MPTIDPKNLTAQSSHRARGNPPSTLPSSAISNCFPGLEFDFRNIWKRIFVGMEMHEARPLVVGVETSAPSDLQALLGQLLVSIDGEDLFVAVNGPQQPGGPNVALGGTNLEWSNALANTVRKGGSQVQCVFFHRQTQQTTPISLEVRRVFDHDLDGNQVINERAVFAKELAEPGALTQSLCSPWQNDYLECACYYWAASRPDMVNAELKPDGTTDGNNWIQRNRDANSPAEYSLRRADLLTYLDLFRNWEEELKFVEKGQSE